MSKKPREFPGIGKVIFTPRKQLWGENTSLTSEPLYFPKHDDKQFISLSVYFNCFGVKIVLSQFEFPILLIREIIS